MRSVWDLVPRLVEVDARLGREPEHALADDVALDLVGAAADRDRRRGEEQRLPFAVADHAVRAEELERGVRGVLQQIAAAELAAGAFGSGRTSGPCGVARPTHREAAELGF